MIGTSARTLGVRQQVDIPIVGGMVSSNTGGMSVAPDRPENLHPLRRPAHLGGLGKDPVWSFDLADLDPGLFFRQDASTHGLFEPAKPMSFDEFQLRLANTKRLWKKLP
jgi:hypothetical protein